MAEDPLLDFIQINSELALFDPELARKPQVVALNKMDLPDVQARWPEIAKDLKKHTQKKEYANVDPEPFAISAAAGSDVRRLLWRALPALAGSPACTHHRGNARLPPEERPQRLHHQPGRRRLACGRGCHRARRPHDVLGAAGIDPTASSASWKRSASN